MLAAGDGTRLQSLTTVAPGASIPKQFCSLRPGPSLLDQTLSRAAALCQRAHICCVVAVQHQPWWQLLRWPLAEHNLLIQPQNRGTAIGMLLPLMHILQRDPEAFVVFLPSDHYVQKEGILRQAMRQALSRCRQDDRSIVLLGLEPESLDTQLGYIVPEDGGMGAWARVARFVEKPGLLETKHLVAAGALWNAFIVVAKARALLQAMWARLPSVVEQMAQAFCGETGSAPDVMALETIYYQLPNIDFSTDVLQGTESRLTVLRVPACGWSDLGTPERVGETLRRTPSELSFISPSNMLGLLVLATQYERRYPSAIGHVS